MGLFTKKPTTVQAVFEKAVEDIRAIQDNSVAEQKRLSDAQAVNVAKLDAEKKRLEEETRKVEEEFKESSRENASAKVAAEKERMMASKVINNFAEMFGVSAK